MTDYPKHTKLNPKLMTVIHQGKGRPLESLDSHRPEPRWPLWLSAALIVGIVVVMGVSTGLGWPL